MRAVCDIVKLSYPTKEVANPHELSGSLYIVNLLWDFISVFFELLNGWLD
jgi:hypothetical protein